MFKVVRVDKELEEWDIISNESGEVVARIEAGWSYGTGNRKELFVKDKKICDIKNQHEALVKLVEFFAENLRNTEFEKGYQRELLSNLNVVEGHYTYNLILKEINVVEERIKELEQYNLS